MSAFTDEWREEFRFGSAHWADEHAMRTLREARGIYLGLDERGRVLRHPSDVPALMIAGSGAGKALSGGLMYNCISWTGSLLALDLKGELAAVSMIGATMLGKPVYCVNPSGLPLPNHPTDPLDILSAHSPTLVPDAKAIAEMLVAFSGSSSGRYFEEKARLLLEAIIITDAEGTE